MITRNNYEEFFLLYIDDELSPADRQAVERFVGEHPDLKEEFDVILQCKISPDAEASFPGMASLLKLTDASSSIGHHNYETWFLSYIDGELSEPDRQKVTDFVRQHPEKNIELQRLQRTVNTPDLAIVFPHKESLYRKEEKRKIAWLPFARIAAAAIVLGVIGVLFFHPFRKDQPLAKNSPSNIHVAPVIKKHPITVTPPAADTLYLSKGGEQKITAPRQNSTRKVETEQVLAKVDPPGTVRPDETTPPIKDIDPGPSIHLAVVDTKMTDRTIKVPPTITVIADRAPNTEKTNASFASQALLSQTSYTDDDSQEERTSPRKNRLRGIFRKVTRTLEKPAAREDDDNKKVIIGGFQFALK